MNAAQQRGLPTPSALITRERAARQRDAASARVRRITIGAMTASVALAAGGAVVLAAPSAPPSVASSVPAVASGATPGASKAGGVTMSAAGQPGPVAVTGGS